MTFPAWDDFDGDLRVNPRHLRVYRWCRKNLDFQEVRYAKREVIAAAVGVHRRHIAPVLNDLVEWGYIREHQHEARFGRRFTLLYSRREGAKTAPIGPASEGEAAA